MTDSLGLVSAAALADCASEPIRIPGAIQPHGYLFALDVETLSLQHASANLASLLDRSIDGLLGGSLDQWLGDVQVQSLTRLLDGRGDGVSRNSLLTVGAHLFSVSVYRLEGLFVVELETFKPAVLSSEPLLARTLSRLQSAVDLQALHEITVTEIRELTGCDRVIIYAFDPDGHGRVLAEAKTVDVDSYLGLQFPASDVPTQARALYELNWLRMIPDVDYSPVPIVGLQTAESGAPLDLTYSTLRSVSPIHREYMRNMGTSSSMSISLMRNGKLWGLVSCVHRAPKLLSQEVRAASLSLGRLLSLQISALEGLSEQKLLDANLGLLAPLTAQMRFSPNGVLTGMTDVADDLLSLVKATGVAVVNGERVELMGECPSSEQVLALASWALPRTLSSGFFASGKLGAEYEAAIAFAGVASGLLAVCLPKPEPTLVLWFRSEVVGTVSWGGDPDKVPSFDPHSAAMRLSPRNSFGVWKTLLSQQSSRWERHEIAAALEFRRTAIEFDLADQVLRERKAVASRDELVAVVSHDLRSPLQVVALQASMLIRTLVADTTAPARRMTLAAQSIQRATSRMTEMLRDLLDLSTIEQGRYTVELSSRAVDDIFEDSAVMLSPMAEAKRITLNFVADPGLVAMVDAERIYQVIANLVGNALKFTTEGGVVDVLARVDSESGGRLVQFVVADTGPGMTAEQMDHIFERYWRVRDCNPTGTGLGLYIAQGIVQAHGGTLRVESDLGVGSTFYFTVAAEVSPASPEPASLDRAA